MTIFFFFFLIYKINKLKSIAIVRKNSKVDHKFFDVKKDVNFIVFKFTTQSDEITEYLSKVVTM